MQREDGGEVRGKGRVNGGKGAQQQRSTRPQEDGPGNEGAGVRGIGRGDGGEGGQQQRRTQRHPGYLCSEYRAERFGCYSPTATKRFGCYSPTATKLSTAPRLWLLQPNRNQALDNTKALVATAQPQPSSRQHQGPPLLRASCLAWWATRLRCRPLRQRGGY
eukprot:365718-Chlamydomonas_euryale.AAC.1